MYTMNPAENILHFSYNSEIIFSINKFKNLSLDGADNIAIS